MHRIHRLDTPRISLQNWKRDDYTQFAKMNADPEVMRYFPSLLSLDESNALSRKFDNLVQDRGWGFWVARRKSDNEFLGLVGLNQPDDLPVKCCIEVGWRLARPYWGNGYATEAAAASLHFAFELLGQDRVAAFTSVKNLPSRKVMSRLGMKNLHRNFLHPRVPEGNELQEHVHYEIERAKFYRDFEVDSVTIS